MHKVALQVGGLTIYWYGVLVATGFLCGLWTASRRCLREGVSGETIADLGPWLILGSLVGARLLYVISYWREQFAREHIWEIFMIRHGGLVFYGGLIGASLAVIFYARVKGVALWKLADILAPSIPLGHAFGRLGCLMNGCCYGRPTDLPWGIHYPFGHESGGGAVHPTQIYEAGLNLGLYALLAWFYRHKKFEGQIFALYLLGYSILRAFVETFRGDYRTYYLGGWATPAQLVSAVMLLVGAFLWFQLSHPRSAL